MPTPPSTLRTSLEAHNATFSALLALIPAKYYLAPADDAPPPPSKYHKNTKTRAEAKHAKRARVRIRPLRLLSVRAS
jgi:hypothetical protein